MAAAGVADPARTFAEFGAAVDLRRLPPEAIEKAKACFLDFLACALAGRSRDGVREVARLLTRWGGAPEAHVLGRALRVPVPAAALANATMAHALDFDDTHDAALLHPSVTVVPAALATAEWRGVDGAALLAGVVPALELVCRLGVAAAAGGMYRTTNSGFIMTTVAGTYGAALAAALIERPRDAAAAAAALGIAHSLAAGNMQCREDAATTKRMQPGFAAMNGCLAAALACEGVRGAEHPFAGEFGYFRLYCGGAGVAELIGQDLGVVYRFLDTSFKPYPSCRATHGAIDLALRLHAAGAVTAQNVEQVEVRVPDVSVYHLVARPFARSGNDEVDAQFSIPFAVARALQRGRFDVTDLDASLVDRDDALRRLVGRVHVAAEGKPAAGGLCPVTLSVVLRDGQRLEATAEALRGDPAAALSREDLVAKFHECAAAVLPEPARRARVVILVDSLDRLPDLAELVDLVS